MAAGGTTKECRACRYWGTKYSMVMPKKFNPVTFWYPCIACHHKGRRALIHPSKDFWEKAEKIPGKPRKQRK